MVKYKIEFSEVAKNDLNNIIKYIRYDLNEINVAKRLLYKIKEKIYKLLDYPKLFPIIDDEFIKKFEIRKLVIDNYIVFYKVIDKTQRVQIVRIMYGRREWLKLL